MNLHTKRKKNVGRNHVSSDPRNIDGVVPGAGRPMAPLSGQDNRHHHRCHQPKTAGPKEGRRLQICNEGFCKAQNPVKGKQAHQTGRMVC
ncbi:hypothetical protein BaRGS_00010066, partial [Batillaria attramentaria]